MKIVVASTNPVKIEATRVGFSQVFGENIQLIGISIPSGVSDQPMSDDETHRGAKNRALNARQAYPDADYWVGIEGGIEEHLGVLTVFAWIVILNQDRTGHARTATFILPDEVAKLVKQGLELGDADDIVFGRANSKQQNGSVGLLTHDRIDRAGYYSPAVILALIPFINPELSFVHIPL